MLVPEELRSSVRRGAAERVERLAAAAQRAEAKVAHLDAGAAGVEDVLGLQIAVDDVVFMLQWHKDDGVIEELTSVFKYGSMELK